LLHVRPTEPLDGVVLPEVLGLQRRVPVAATRGGTVR
jgi:hypothetical protein